MDLIVCLMEELIVAVQINYLKGLFQDLIQLLDEFGFVTAIPIEEESFKPQ